MEDVMITVPLGDYTDGVMARADLDNIRAMLANSDEYCSDSIKAVLGIETDKQRRRNKEINAGGTN